MVQVVITEDDPEPYHEHCLCNFGGSPEIESRGRKLAEALQAVKHGRTIEIAARCSCSVGRLSVNTSVRLILKLCGLKRLTLFE